MKKVPVLPKLISRLKKDEATRPSSLVFCERTTGVTQFEAGCGSDLDSNIERTASLLAMQCLVRGSDPCDYAILVPVEDALAARVTERAKELLDAGMAVANPVPLSPRQTEILRAVVRNNANKEIAAKFNITVRTVKFHISTLFSKFGVDNRVELARKATGVLRSQVNSSETMQAQEASSNQRNDNFGPISLESVKANLVNRHRGERFAQRVLSA